MYAGVPSTLPAWVWSSASRGARPVAQPLVEGAALDEPHGQEWPAIGEGAEIVDGGDAGVLELAGDQRLVDEAAGGGGPALVVLLQHLDGDLTAEGRVGGAE